tara:strand:+ start:63 stop:302 length:240 start_codon:yes stop_codon:yes gene_type:complete
MIEETWRAMKDRHEEEMRALILRLNRAALRKRLKMEDNDGQSLEQYKDGAVDAGRGENHDDHAGRWFQDCGCSQEFGAK